MIWLPAILGHSLVCLVVLVDAVSADMTARARWYWLAATTLLPLIGVTAYTVWRSRG